MAAEVSLPQSSLDDPHLHQSADDVMRRRQRYFIYLLPLSVLPVLVWMLSLSSGKIPVLYGGVPDQYIPVWSGYNSNVLVDDSAAQEQHARVRVFCWILTREPEIKNKLPAVNDTWARRCDGHVYIMTTSKSHPFPDVVDLKVKEGRKHLTEKSRAALMYIREHYLEQYDWFLKADDDSFIVMENLKFLLSHYRPEEGVYIGHLFKKYSPWGYMSGGAGYVLSREAVRLIVDKGYNKTCKKAGTDEDVEVAACLHNVGVPVHNSLDRFDRETFHAFSISAHVNGHLPKDIQNWDRHKTKTGLECCSQLTISFHYVDPRQMRMLEFLLYRTSVYGRKADTQFFTKFFQIGVVPSLSPEPTKLKTPTKARSSKAKQIPKRNVTKDKKPPT